MPKTTLNSVYMANKPNFTELSFEKQLYAGSYIRTYTDRYVDVFNLTTDDIDIIDIAHGLSMTPRWRGHTDYFFPVSQHSVFCCMKLLTKYRAHEAKEQKSLLLELLLHDASESYIADVPSPIKSALPTYRSIEDNLQRIIYEKFGVKSTDESRKIVKQIDRAELEYEFRHFYYCKNSDEAYRFIASFKDKSFSKFKRDFIDLYEHIINL